MMAQEAQAHAMVDKVFAESEQRCLMGDIDGATLNMIKWWNKDMPKMDLSQTMRLFDVCVLHWAESNFKASPLGKWVDGCVSQVNDCRNPPMKESFAQMTEGLNKAKIQSGLNKVFGPYRHNAGAHLHPEKQAPDPRIAVSHEGPGVWVRGCFWCSVASNMAYMCDTDYDRQCLIKDDPMLKSIDTLLFDKLLPFLFDKTRGGPTPPPPPSLTEPPLEDQHSGPGHLHKPDGTHYSREELAKAAAGDGNYNDDGFLTDRVFVDNDGNSLPVR